MGAAKSESLVDWKTTVVGIAVLASLVAAILVGLWAIGKALETPEDAAARAASIEKYRQERAAEAKACAADAECATEDIKSDAMAACIRPVEGLASYSAEWIGGMTPRFIGRAWRDREKNVVMLFGAGIKFQNGLGAWQRHRYECDYDIGKKAVVGVRAYPYSG